MLNGYMGRIIYPCGWIDHIFLNNKRQDRGYIMKIYHGNSLNLMRALSMALELLSVNLSFHHWRVAIIAMAIAEEMKLPYKMSATLLQASLLHDIGAAPNWNTRVKLRSGKNYEEKK